MTSDSANTPGRKRRNQRGRCPICNQPSAACFRPFCSARCADIDLGRWFRGHYTIPTEDEPEDGGEVETDDTDQGPKGGGSYR